MVGAALMSRAPHLRFFVALTGRSDNVRDVAALFFLFFKEGFIVGGTRAVLGLDVLQRLLALNCRQLAVGIVSHNGLFGLLVEGFALFSLEGRKRSRRRCNHVLRVAVGADDGGALKIVKALLTVLAGALRPARLLGRHVEPRMEWKSRGPVCHRQASVSKRKGTWLWPAARPPARLLSTAVDRTVPRGLYRANLYRCQSSQIYKESLSVHGHTPKPLATRRASALTGKVRVPGDKSISHRALIFGALATGETRIRGLLEAEDVINTAKAVTELGAPAGKQGDTWVVKGRGVGGLHAPSTPLDFGNSGTGTRLMMGVIAGHPITVIMTGDLSLSRRPMRRVLAPLMEMGLEVLEPGREMLPLTLRGTADLIPIVYKLPVPSAQVKSAVLIAGLHAAGETTVVEREATRDHTERMLRHFGADVRTELKDGLTHITVKGDAELRGQNIEVPADPSSAAFLTAAALIVPGSDITIEGVLINPTRTGFYTTLQEMGGDVAFTNVREESGEPIADIRVRASKLKGVHVPAGRAPSMIDEYPVLAAVAGFASGEVRMDGLAELKVKESDRLKATADGLIANGVEAQIDGDTLLVKGRGTVKGGGTVATHLDHRIAMAFLTAGLASEAPITVDDTTMIATSFPEFTGLMEAIGAKFDNAG